MGEGRADSERSEYCGHILIVADLANLDSFEEQARQINERVTQPKDNISIDEFTAVFSNLDEHLVIPHYDKNQQSRVTSFSV